MSNTQVGSPRPESLPRSIWAELVNAEGKPDFINTPLAVVALVLAAVIAGALGWMLSSLVIWSAMKLRTGYLRPADKYGKTPRAIILAVTLLVVSGLLVWLTGHWLTLLIPVATNAIDALVEFSLADVAEATGN